MKIGDLVQWVYHPPALGEGDVGVVVHVDTSPADPVGAGAGTAGGVIPSGGITDTPASGVTAATGIALYAGDVYSVEIGSGADVYVISSVDGEDVQWVSFN